MSLVTLLAALFSALSAAAPASAPPADDKTLEIVLAIVAVIGTVLGSIIGSRLSERADRRARGEERAHAEQRRLADEERGAVKQLDEALADAEREAIIKIENGEPVAAVELASQHFDPAYWRHTTRLTESVLKTRLFAVNILLTGAHVAAPAETGTIDYGLREGLRRVIANARVSLNAFLLAKDLPDAGSPTREKIMQLLREGESEKTPFECMRQWLQENPPCGEVKAYLEAGS